MTKRTQTTAFSRFRGDSAPSVIIIGGGFAGIAAGVKLTRAGFTNFTILEKSDGPGGTWWDNRYPGAEVDVGSHLYSYSFKSHDWTRTHARQPELQAYLEGVIDEYALRPHFRFATTAMRATWDEADSSYLVELDSGDSLRCNVLVTAVGLLNVPRYPDWPGLADFKGPKFHTARWEPEHDLAGKRVAVVGTGSTATQIVPAIAPEVEHLTLYQREPGWVMPKGDRDYTQEDRARFRMPMARRRERWRLLYQLERNQFRGKVHRPGTALNTLRESQCRQYLDYVFKDRPDLKEAVTPNYAYPGKRPVLCGTFLPALLRDNVELVPRAVVSVTPTGIVDSDGVERPADVLVMATGFQPANFLATLEMVGRGGISLKDFWDGEPQAFLGLEVPHFPNFYMLYGPNTNGGEIVSHLERQAEYVTRRLRRMARDNIAALEVRPSLYRRYNKWLQQSMAATSWVTTNNYYKSASGRIVTQWPYGPLVYGLLTRFPSHISAVATRSQSPHARDSVPTATR